MVTKVPEEVRKAWEEEMNQDIKEERDREFNQEEDERARGLNHKDIFE